MTSPYRTHQENLALWFFDGTFVRLRGIDVSHLRYGIGGAVIDPSEIEGGETFEREGVMYGRIFLSNRTLEYSNISEEWFDSFIDAWGDAKAKAKNHVEWLISSLS